ncbi:MAG TPA: choice-of-anchor tandem repeat GloVer-containing protein, partial [Candidatus Tumulicola sp.]|nr:choice-of-anchor tandem repeat GloVer-containing protein [Candidatus Tumulicola sp.]
MPTAQLPSSPLMNAQHRIRPDLSYQTLYSFGGRVSFSDGYNPRAALLNVNGRLYGTTENGGANGNPGTVYTIGRFGKESVLHNFGGTDGANPGAALINVAGTLYGTTESGGAYPSTGGTVYSISATGAETVLHTFGTGSDGSDPVAGLVDVKGTLYGTTSQGGAYGFGTVYSISTSGTETVLHSFSSVYDGATPLGGLVDVHGTLYGTTLGGGPYGFGTVYSITTSGTETVLHSFGALTDGVDPASGLIKVKGMLYGTAEAGG